MENNKETCPKCKKDIKGAKYYVASLKQWLCKNCFFESE